METLAHAYWEALADLPDERFEYAVREAVRTCRYFPVPAELRDLALPPAPPRDPEADFDLIRASHHNQGTSWEPPLLPEVAAGPEQQAERERRWAESRDQAQGQMRRAAAQYGGGWRHSTRRERVTTVPIEARQWLESIKVRREGGKQPDA